MITQKEIKEIFDYNKLTGELIWKVDRGSNKVCGKIAGNINKASGYRVIGLNKKLYLAHKLVWLLHYGFFPKEIDHVNHIKLDNRIENLESVTHQENSRNQRIRSSNKSGTLGIYYCKSNSKWRVFINIEGKQRYLGFFKNIEDAILVRREAEEKYGYHKNHGRD